MLEKVYVVAIWGEHQGISIVSDWTVGKYPTCLLDVIMWEICSEQIYEYAIHPIVKVTSSTTNVRVCCMRACVSAHWKPVDLDAGWV